MHRGLPCLAVLSLLLSLMLGLGWGVAGAAPVPHERVRAAALVLAQERWPEARLLDLTPYLGLDGSVQAYAAQVATVAGDGLTAEELATAMTQEPRSEASPQVAVDIAPEANGQPLAGPRSWSAADRGLLAHRVGTVLVAARDDLYPLLERYDGVAPHLRPSQSGLAGLAAQRPSPVYYLGPCRYLRPLAGPVAGYQDGLSGRVLTAGDLTQPQTVTSPSGLPPAPLDKNSRSPQQAWRSLGGDISLEAATASLPATARLVAGVPYYHQNDYGPEACAPTAAAQILAAWDGRGYGVLVDGGGAQDGHVAALVRDLMAAMGYDASGTAVERMAPGLTAVTNGPAYGNGLQFSTAVASGLSWAKDVVAEIDAGRPFLYANTDRKNYPYWAHATAVVGYATSGAHILYVHWNFPPDSPYEINWDNVPPANELQVKIYPGGRPFQTVVSEDFDGPSIIDWVVDNRGQATRGWGLTSHRVAQPTPSMAVEQAPARALYCGGENAAPGPYAPGADSWLRYGPFSTLAKQSGTFQGQIWRDLLGTLPLGDSVSLLASVDGVHFHGQEFGGSFATWQPMALDLAQVPGLGSVLNEPKVWVALRFRSLEGLSGAAEGAYVDNLAVSLRDPVGWWYDPAHPGTGLSLEVQGSRLYMAWYVYDADGQCRWYVCLAERAGGAIFQGQLMEARGPVVGKAVQASLNPVGQVQMELLAGNRLRLGWDLDSGKAQGSQEFVRLLDAIAPGAPDGRDISGWWQDDDHPGTGVFLEAQGGRLYLSWYHYREDGSSRWWSLGGEPGGFLANARSYQGSFVEWSGGQTLAGAYVTPVSQVRAQASLALLQNGQLLLAVDGVVYHLRRFSF